MINLGDVSEYHIVLTRAQLDLLMNLLGCVEAKEQENGLDCAEITALAQHIDRSAGSQ